MTAPLAVLTIDAAQLPLSRENRALLVSRLDDLAGCFGAVQWEWLDTATTTLGVEYAKGEHRSTLRIAIMPTPSIPERGIDIPQSGATP